MVIATRLIAHGSVSGPAPFVAIGLFFAGIGAAIGAGWWYAKRGNRWRPGPLALGTIAAVCFIMGTALPLFLGARPSLARPSSTAQLSFVDPSAGQAFTGDPASVEVSLHLVGGRIVPFSSLRLEPNEGHIHLSLDGTLVTMTTGLETTITAPPGDHVLRADFVAVDHAPFDPPVSTSVAFSVRA